MKIKDVLAKVAKGEELSDEEKTFLEGYEEPNLDAAVNAKGKKERLKLEGQVEAMKTELAEKNAELEDAGADVSEMEKMQKQMEKLNLKFEQTQTALKSEQEAHSTTQRSNALKSVNVPWLESVPNEYRNSVLGKAFDGIDTEDLKDPDVVKPIVTSILENQAAFVQASTTSGAGTNVKEKTSISEGTKITIDNVGSLKGETLLKNIDEAFAVANQGA